MPRKKTKRKTAKARVEKVKGVGRYIDIAKFPIVVLLILSILNSIFKEVPMFWMFVILLALAVFGYVGWSAVKKYKFTLWQSALAGATASLVADLIYLAALLILGANILVEYGVNISEVPSAEIAPTFTAIVVFVSIIFSAIIAAIAATIGAAVAQRTR